MPVENALSTPSSGGRDDLKPGCAHIIDLCAVRSAMGPLWNTMQDGVRGRLEHVIGQRLSSTDYYERLDAERYLIVTPSARDGEGAVFAVRVMIDFLTALNGTCAFGDIHIEVAESDSKGGVRGRPVPVTVLIKVVEKAGLSDIMLPPQLRGAAVQTKKDQPAGQAVRPLNTVHHFEPLWDARNQAITTYMCVPQSITAAETPDTPVAMSDLNVRERTTIELAGLVKGVGFMSKFVEAGDRFLLCVPISFETLCSPYGRTEFTGICRGLPATYRQYLIFLLTDVPLGVTHSRLSDLAVVLKPFGRIIASVASGCRNFTSYTGHGFSGLALDLAKGGNDIERKRADIVYIGAAGHNTGWGSALINFDDQQLVSAVNAADYRFLHGKLVAQPVSEPRRMTRLLASSVFPDSGDAGSEEWF